MPSHLDMWHWSNCVPNERLLHFSVIKSLCLPNMSKTGSHSNKRWKTPFKAIPLRYK